MSACAPAYRSLFVKVFSSSSSSLSNHTPGEYPTIGSGGPVYARRRAAQNDIELFSVLSAGKRTSGGHVSPCRGRNSSEDNMLCDEGIRKTIDVSVIEEEARKERRPARDDPRNGNDPTHWQ